MVLARRRLQVRMLPLQAFEQTGEATPAAGGVRRPEAQVLARQQMQVSLLPL